MFVRTPLIRLLFKLTVLAYQFEHNTKIIKFPELLEIKLQILPPTDRSNSLTHNVVDKVRFYVLE